jgi:hypothetical protein
MLVDLVVQEQNKINKMTSEQLSVIKGYQKDYQNRFGDRLEIDWLGMKKIKLKQLVPLDVYKDDVVVNKELEDILNEAVEKYKANLNIIKTTKRIGKRFPKERRALVEFARIIKANRLNYESAANLINKDRTMIYHYSYETKV